MRCDINVLIESLVTPLKKGQSTNSTASSFSALIPTLTRPVASATRTVIEWALDSGSARKDRNTLKITPYGGNDNNDVINIKVSGWNSIQSNVLGIPGVEYVSRFVCEVQGTLSSTLLGLAGQAVLDTEFFCDALTLTAGIAVLYNGTADKDIAWFEVDVSSYEFAEITYSKVAGGDAVNCLYNF